MKLILIVAVALPMLSVGAGYAVGLQFAEAAPAQAAEAHADEGPADPVVLLMDAAEDNAAHPAAAHDAPAKTDETHGTDEHAAPDATKADAGHGKAKAVTPGKISKDVVKLGSMMVPVYKAASVTYVVADFGVAMPDAQTAAHYRIAENATRLRDAIMTSFREASEHPKMKRAAIDSDWLSATLTNDLRTSFAEAQEVLFLSLIKKDVPRS